MIRKIFLCIIIFYSFSCKKESDQSHINIDSLINIKDSLNTVLGSEEHQVYLLQLSLQYMNDGNYKEAIQNFNTLKSKYPFSILDNIINDNIKYCKSMLDTIASKESTKSEIQIQAEKKTGVEILSVKSYWEESKPGLKIILKNISNNEIPKLNIEIQFLDEVKNLIFAKGNYLLESGIEGEQSIVANILGNSEYEFSAKNVTAKIFIQTSSTLVYFEEITFKAKRIRPRIRIPDLK